MGGGGLVSALPWILEGYFVLHALNLFTVGQFIVLGQGSGKVGGGGGGGEGGIPPFPRFCHALLLFLMIL